jgi:hypothetical protein
MRLLSRFRKDLEIIMIININEKYRIHSNESTWDVERLSDPKKDCQNREKSKGNWLKVAYCSSLINAMNYCLQYQIRLISDQRNIHEILEEIDKIGKEIKSAFENTQEIV